MKKEKAPHELTYEEVEKEIDKNYGIDFIKEQVKANISRDEIEKNYIKKFGKLPKGRFQTLLIQAVDELSCGTPEVEEQPKEEKGEWKFNQELIARSYPNQILKILSVLNDANEAGLNNYKYKQQDYINALDKVFKT